MPYPFTSPLNAGSGASAGEQLHPKPSAAPLHHQQQQQGQHHCGATKGATPSSLFFPSLSMAIAGEGGRSPPLGGDDGALPLSVAPPPPSSSLCASPFSSCPSSSAPSLPLGMYHLRSLKQGSQYYLLMNSMGAGEPARGGGPSTSPSSSSSFFGGFTASVSGWVAQTSRSQVLLSKTQCSTFIVESVASIMERRRGRRGWRGDGDSVAAGDGDVCTRAPQPPPISPSIVCTPLAPVPSIRPTVDLPFDEENNIADMPREYTAAPTTAASIDGSPLPPLGAAGDHGAAEGRCAARGHPSSGAGAGDDGDYGAGVATSGATAIHSSANSLANSAASFIADSAVASTVGAVGLAVYCGAVEGLLTVAANASAKAYRSATNRNASVIAGGGGGESAHADAGGDCNGVDGSAIPSSTIVAAKSTSAGTDGNAAPHGLDGSSGGNGADLFCIRIAKAVPLLPMPRTCSEATAEAGQWREDDCNLSADADDDGNIYLSWDTNRFERSSNLGSWESYELHSTLMQPAPPSIASVYAHHGGRGRGGGSYFYFLYSPSYRCYISCDPLGYFPNKLTMVSPSDITLEDAWEFVAV